jgi:hypothetical protein
VLPQILLFALVAWFPFLLGPPFKECPECVEECPSTTEFFQAEAMEGLYKLMPWAAPWNYFEGVYLLGAYILTLDHPLFLSFVYFCNIISIILSTSL